MPRNTTDIGQNTDTVFSRSGGTGGSGGPVVHPDQIDTVTSPAALLAATTKVVVYVSPDPAIAGIYYDNGGVYTKSATADDESSGLVLPAAATTEYASFLLYGQTPTSRNGWWKVEGGTHWVQVTRGAS